MVVISGRPVDAEDRAVPGFWEGDLIIGKDGASQIATLVERTTRYLELVRIPSDRNAEHGNENTNGSLRHYFPKGTDLSGYTQQELDAVAAELNGRPRETPGWLKPIEVFTKLLLDSGVALTP